MTALTNEQRKARLATGLKWGLGLLGAAIIAPLVFLAVQGLARLIIAGVLELATTGTHPAWTQVDGANKGKWPYLDLAAKK